MFSDMDPGQEKETTNDLRIQTATDLAEGDDLTHGKGLSSCSSSLSSLSSSSSEDALELGANKKETSSLGNHDKDTQLASENSEEDIPVSSMPSHERLSDNSNNFQEFSSQKDSETQFPPPQMMERENDSSPSSSYRIPDYVFARTKSTAPMEWSVASNESLFSIHMGNMSFTRDQLVWLGKSGELGLHSEPPMSSPLIDRSSNQPPVQNPIDMIRKSGKLEMGISATEAAAAERMREVIRENEENCSSNTKEKPSIAVEPPLSSSRLSRNSDESGVSTRSFAFPILIGEGDKNDSVSIGAGKRKSRPLSQPLSQPQTPKSQPETPKETPRSQVQTPKDAPKATPKGWYAKWFSCFSRCPFCS